MSALQDWRFSCAFAALLLLVASVFVPPWRVPRRVHDVIVVMDITTSMNVRDVRLDGSPATRLALEKRAARALLANLPCGSRLGIAVFAERVPFLLFEPVEVCANFPPLDAEIAALDWRMAWDSESHIAIGVANALRLAREEGTELIFMTDGDEMPPLWWTGPPDFKPLRGRVAGLLVGVGDYRLSPMPKYDSYGREIGNWRPGELPAQKDGLFRGQEYLSSVDEPHLRALAGATGLAYLHLTTPDGLLPALDAAAPPRWHMIFVPLRWLPAALAFGLLILAQIDGAVRRRLRLTWRLSRVAALRAAGRWS